MSTDWLEQLAPLLDQYAPFRPVPLVPEISAFYGRSLVEVWEAAEKLAGVTLPAPFWAYPWAGGAALARVILDHPTWLQGKRVLDFGCGGGVVALAAARAGARPVIANDVDPSALRTVQLAAERQNLQVTPLLRDLTRDLSSVDSYDVVCCSDLAYERSTAPRQLALLQRARNKGARVLVADAGRTYFNANGMQLLATYTIKVPRDLEGVEERTASVYQLI